MRAFIRGVIAVVVLIGTANLVGGLVHLHDNGTFGFTYHYVAVDNHSSLLVDAVVPNSPAARSGIRPGDKLSYEASFANRVIISAPAPGDRIRFIKAGEPLDLSAQLDTGPVPWALLIIATTSKLAFLVMALLIAWRRPDDSAALALSLFLACFGSAIDYDFVIFPIVAIRFASFLFVQSAFLTGGLAVLAFACWFPDRAQSGIRRLLERLLLPLGVVGYGTTAMSFFASYVVLNHEVTSVASTIYLFNYLAIIAATMTALVTSYRHAVREARARMRWVLGTFALGFSGLLVLFVTLVLNVSAPWAQYVALTILAIPFGLGYVILRHRVIDIGFVVNRAVVYTGVSLVVVGAFIVFEWLVAHVVEENSRASTVIELGGALALGLSVRFIHGRVDRWVDDLFFRDRHIAEAAIRRFAHETGMITDPEILIRRTVEVAERNARVFGAAFYARLGSKYVPLHSTFPSAGTEVDENDEAILDMRTWQQPVDIGAESSVPGYAAFPMIVRGQLSGFLACGEKTTHEALAPDERDALRVLSRDAGIALDSLRITRIERELGFLAGDGELPTGIRMRLASLIGNNDEQQRASEAARLG